MELKSFVHKGLKSLYLDDDAKGVPPDAVDKLRAMLTFLQDLGKLEQLYSFPLWKAHQLTGARKGFWSLHVTRNWRLTFAIKNGAIVRINYEDYH